MKNFFVLFALIFIIACSKDPVPYEKKEGVIIDQGNTETYAWADLTYGNMPWIERTNASKSSTNGYYYFFDGDEVVIQAKETPTKVFYFETAKSTGKHLEFNDKNVVRVKLGEYGSFNFHYAFKE